MKKNYVTYKDKYNTKYGYKKNESHTLEEISKDTGVSIKGLQQIYNKGIGAYKTNPSSVRPNVKSKEQWAMARVYSAVMGGKASKIDSNELKMEKGGLIAPNGKKSNLTALQYKLVRTPEFKAWFGYWDLIVSGKAKNYQDEGIREIAHLLKQGDLSAIKKVAKFLSQQVSENDILIPMPSRKGCVTDNHSLLLSNEIAKISGAIVYSDLCGDERDSLYNMKKQNIDLKDVDLGLFLKSELPVGANYFIVDNVIGTGFSMYNAQLIVGNNAQPLVYAVDERNISKVVDENGEPLVVYRGSKSKNPNYTPNKHELSKGIYFSTKKDIAELYTTSVWQNWVGRVFDCFLNIKNIDYYDTLKFKSNIYQADFDFYNKLVVQSKKNNFDGIRWDNFIDVPDLQTIFPKEPIDYIASTFIVFEPEQIKLADGTNTTFDGNNPDIRFNEGGTIGVYTAKLIEELKKYSDYKEGEVLTNAEGEKYRYHYWKLKYRSASNWLVQLFMRASKENTGVDYNKRFAVGDYSFYYDRPEMKGQPNGSMQMRKLEVLGKYEKGGDIKKFPKNYNLKTKGINPKYNFVLLLIEKNGDISLMGNYSSYKSAIQQKTYWENNYAYPEEVEQWVVDELVETPNPLKMEKGGMTRKYSEGGKVISDRINSKLESMGFVRNPSNYLMGKKINENLYIQLFYDKNKDIYKIRGVKKFKTTLGGNSIGLQFDFDNEKDFFDKINELSSESNEMFAEGGKITQFEIESMRNYINSPNPNPKLKDSFEKVLRKFGVDLERSDLSDFTKGRYVNPYNFSGYEYMRKINEEAGVSFLLTGEYELVSKAIYEKDYAMWLFYSYLGRINISFKACENWLQQAQEYFEHTMPIPIWLVHTPNAKDGRSYAMWVAVSNENKAQAESRLGRPLVFEYEGRYYYQEIGMVANFDAKNSDGWGSLYKEKKTGLLIPEYTETSFHFNTLIHEFSHCLDFQTQLLKNIDKYDNKKAQKISGEIEINTQTMSDAELALYANQLRREEAKDNVVSLPITNHFDEFVDSLIRVLRACAGGHIPLTQLYEQQALDVQTALEGVYGDLLLEQRARREQERKEVEKADQMRENTRFSWQTSWINDIKKYALQNALQADLKEKLQSTGKNNFTLSEIIELDNLITQYFNMEFKKYMIQNPTKGSERLEDIKRLKQETNRIINNHYDNIKSGFQYGFQPQNELEYYISENCKLSDFRDYKSWKDCVKEKLEKFG